MMWMMLGGSAWAGSVGATVGLGLERMLDTEDVVSTDTVVRVALQWEVGELQLGPVAQVSPHNADHYEIQRSELGYIVVPGDFTLIGVGPGVSLPALVETDLLRLGAHADVLVESFSSSMEESYAAEELGEEPRLGYQEILFRPGAGVDVGFALSERRPGPELFISGDVAWRTQLGLAVTAYGGIRVTAVSGR